jgi:hypothetical protein
MIATLGLEYLVRHPDGAVTRHRILAFGSHGEPLVANPETGWLISLARPNPGATVSVEFAQEGWPAPLD